MHDLDDILHKLEEQVNNCLDSPKISNMKGYLSKINIKATAVYGSIPICIIIILILWKPQFVLIKEDDSEIIENTLSFKKMCIAVIFLSVIFDGLLFMYLRKQGITL